MKARPFDFEAHLHPKSRRLDVVPFIDACLIVIFFSLFGSSYVFAPGITINLPESRTAALDALPVYEVLTVGEIEGAERILFDGRIFSLETFRQGLLSSGPDRGETTLLVRMDQDDIWPYGDETGNGRGLVLVSWFVGAGSDGSGRHPSVR